MKQQSVTINTATAKQSDGITMEEAYESLLPEIQAVSEAEFVRMNLDVNQVVTLVLGSLPEIRAFRDAILALPGFEPNAMDRLEEYALASAEANARYFTATVAPQADASLAEAMELRESFRLSAAALVRHGLMDDARLSGFRGLVGYRNVANDVVAYAVLFFEIWPNIEGKTPFSHADLLHAKDVGTRLLYAAGLREQGAVHAEAELRIRNQAFTLLARKYSEVRRAVTYLRWHEGDANSVAPSIYTVRASRKSVGDDNRNEAGPDEVQSHVSVAVLPANASDSTPGDPR
ncbi:MAG: hypothetical protein R3A78_13360 [Polyangiales bacterium]|nr:hypothetical protein [Myxococcales bacterium]